jgi:hypothetical protein
VPQPFQQTILEPTTIPPVPPAQPNQGFKPVPVAAAAPLPGKSNRGLWIGLGALAAVLALVAAATVLPRFFPTHAGQKASTQPAATQTASNTPPANPSPTGSTPDTPPANTPPAGQPGAAGAPTSTPTPAETPAKPGPSVTAPSKTETASNPAPHLSPTPQPRVNPEPAVAPPTQAEPVPSEPVGASPQEVRRARDRFMDLDARAETVRSSVEQMRHQQQAQGYDMRGDMVGALNRMNNNLREADRALNEHDVAAARDYMDRADQDMRRLETFLGR